MTATGQRFDVAIVGAGPAGLAAAIQSAELGLSVALFDEQAAPGGQIYRGIEQASPRLMQVLGADYARGGVLVARFRACGASYFPQSTVSYVGNDLELGVVRGSTLESHECGALVIATGALERPFPISGWTLPGVVAAGGAQALLKGAGLVPEGRLAIAGTGPLAYLMAAQLLEAGVGELTFLDTAHAANRRAAAAHAIGALRRADYLLKGLQLLRRTRSGARVVSGVLKVEAAGAGRVEAVRYATSRESAEIRTDALLLHHGVVPNTQLTRALGLEHEWSEDGCGFRPVLDPWLRSSRRNVFVAGDTGGISGAEAAEHTGRLAALQAAADLGRLGEARRDRMARASLLRLAGLAPLRRFLDRLYRPQPSHRVPTGDTIVCRCEDVTADEVRAAIEHGAHGPNQLKFFTRCGMGPCQGRYCGLTVSEMYAQAAGRSVADVGYFRVRLPVKPLALGTLATAATAIEKAVPYRT